jgi:hypothetical protein
MSEVGVKEEIKKEVEVKDTQQEEKGLTYICPCELRGRVVEALSD